MRSTTVPGGLNIAKKNTEIKIKVATTTIENFQTTDKWRESEKKVGRLTAGDGPPSSSSPSPSSSSSSP